MKKREKKKFNRQQIRYKNIEIDDLDYFHDEDFIEEKRSQKKLLEKGSVSLKDGLDLKKGRIVEVMANYNCLVRLEGEEILCPVGGRLKQLAFETRNPVTVGDFVYVDILKGNRIEEVVERKNSLSRFSENKYQTEIILASNIDQVIITASVMEPMLKLGLIDRYICAAEIYGITPIVCINKIDLLNDLSDMKNICDIYEEEGYKVIYVSVVEKYGIDELRSCLIDKDSVFSGQSGTGKSSIINALQPSLNLRTGEISDYNEKGKHTTTSSRLIKWDFGGNLVDTPGIKTLMLNRNHKALIPKIFPAFSNIKNKCYFNDCTHTHENGCAILEALANEEIYEDRYQSYIRIYESI